MTRQEALKILSILKAAYPNSYRNMSKEEASGTANIWASQFAKYPYMIVAFAINKIISTSTFPPSIGEVKEKIRSMYYEALQELPYQHGGLYASNTQEIDTERLTILKQIVEITQPLQTRQHIEPTLSEMLGQFSAYLADGKNDKLLN